MYKKGAGNDKQGKDAGNRTLCPYRNFSQAIMKSTMLPIRNIAINVNHINGITLSLLKMEISIYCVMDVLDSSRI